MFEVGREVIAYRTPQECAELMTLYLERENERRAIARAGQERTPNTHS
jgi:spore maturation protein CgeB